MKKYRSERNIYRVKYEKVKGIDSITNTAGSSPEKSKCVCVGEVGVCEVGVCEVGVCEVGVCGLVCVGGLVGVCEVGVRGLLCVRGYGELSCTYRRRTSDCGSRGELGSSSSL